MAEDEKKPFIPIAVSVSGIVLICGLLVALGKQISLVEQNGMLVREARSDIAKLRDYIDLKTSNRYTTADNEKDMRYLNQRLESIEKQLEKVEKQIHAN